MSDNRLAIRSRPCTHLPDCRRSTNEMHFPLSSRLFRRDAGPPRPIHRSTPLHFIPPLPPLSPSQPSPFVPSQLTFPSREVHIVPSRRRLVFVHAVSGQCVRIGIAPFVRGRETTSRRTRVERRRDDPLPFGCSVDFDPARSEERNGP